MSSDASEGGFKVKFSNREVSAWGSLALLKRMGRLGAAQAHA